MLQTLLFLNIAAACLGVASVLMKGMTKLRLIAVGADALEFASALASLSVGAEEVRPSVMGVS